MELNVDEPSTDLMMRKGDYEYTVKSTTTACCDECLSPTACKFQPKPNQTNNLLLFAVVEMLGKPATQLVKLVFALAHFLHSVVALT
ncbi:hypothetical protein VNO78_15324 [Psophocarpus tetragonolobus]|uniref:Uncharacterized protein n=1 Tax=Psophocarpus tetragonolobus TaxID=3891 RepID=A0AAN9XJI4_PSOTE